MPYKKNRTDPKVALTNCLKQPLFLNQPIFLKCGLGNCPESQAENYSNWPVVVNHRSRKKLGLLYNQLNQINYLSTGVGRLYFFSQMTAWPLVISFFSYLLPSRPSSRRTLRRRFSPACAPYAWLGGNTSSTTFYQPRTRRRYSSAYGSFFRLWHNGFLILAIFFPGQFLCGAHALQPLTVQGGKGTWTVALMRQEAAHLDSGYIKAKNRLHTSLYNLSS